MSLTLLKWMVGFNPAVSVTMDETPALIDP
jgi:hypothetical protein